MNPAAAYRWHLTSASNGTCSAVGRIFELGGCGINSGVDTDHSAAIGEVAPPLPVFGTTAGWLGLLAATSDLVDKALKPFQIAWYTPSSICRDGWAKSLAGSGIVATWFAG